MKKLAVTCADCYFRRASLCAIAGDTPCPTFRAHTRGALAPPLQPRLVVPPVALVAQHAAA